MAEKFNAKCAVCGKEYKVCRTCSEIKSFKPYRTIVDTAEHYKIHLALIEYTNTKDKDKAKKELQSCDLTGLENFDPDVKRVINEILTEPKVVINKNVKKKAISSEKTNKTENKNE